MPGTFTFDKDGRKVWVDVDQLAADLLTVTGELAALQEAAGAAVEFLNKWADIVASDVPDQPVPEWLDTFADDARDAAKTLAALLRPQPVKAGG